MRRAMPLPLTVVSAGPMNEWRHDCAARRAAARALPGVEPEPGAAIQSNSRRDQVNPRNSKNASRATNALFLMATLGCGSADSGALLAGRSLPGGSPPAASGSAGVSIPGASVEAPYGPGTQRSCAAISQTATNQRGPADIIFALDNSGSMDEEAGFVQANMNSFSQQIVDAAVDVRVVVISSYPGEGNGICIDAPLGSGACPKQDTKMPSFLHVDEKVSSNDALELVIEKFADYRSVLRPGAQKHIVVVTDDESDLSAARARAGILGLAPPLFEGFIVHGIFAFSEGDNDQCEDLASEEGKQYEQLVAETGGVSGDLCLQDFKPVFDRLAQAVVGSSRLACEWAIPAPATGEAVDPRMTNVRYLPSGSGGVSIARVSSAAGCNAAPEGWAWYYDDETRPTKVLTCPAACSTIQKDRNARIDIEFGCPSLRVPEIR